jgi:hypothetical protein
MTNESLTISKATELGIWMDHANADFTEFTKDPLQTLTIPSPFTSASKDHTTGSSENVMNNKEQNKLSDFYKKIGETVLNYKSVLLFGPTNAKMEFHNILKADHRFADIQIETKTADKMNEKQQHAFVQEYFSAVKSENKEG